MRYLLITGCLSATLVGCAQHQESVSQPAPAPVTTAPSIPAPAQPAVAPKPLIDEITIGDEQSEQKHNQKGEPTENGDFSDRTYRDSNNGWFSWDMKVVPNQPIELMVTYAGVDTRRFQVLVDGVQLSDQAQPGSSDAFYEYKYTIPVTMTKDKSTVTIRFQSSTGYAGGVFGIRTMRQGSTPAPQN